MKNESQLKQCPFCAEMIALKAIKCKHCGSMIGELERVIDSKNKSPEEIMKIMIIDIDEKIEQSDGLLKIIENELKEARAELAIVQKLMAGINISPNTNNESIATSSEKFDNSLLHELDSKTKGAVIEEKSTEDKPRKNKPDKKNLTDEELRIQKINQENLAKAKLKAEKQASFKSKAIIFLIIIPINLLLIYGAYYLYASRNN